MVKEEPVNSKSPTGLSHRNQRGIADKVDKFIFNNMRKDKIYELKIDEDDDLSGIDSISLVDEPAIEVEWLAFNKHKHSATEECFHIPDGEDTKYLEMLYATGKPEQDLIEDGYELVSVEVNGEESFLSTSPNAPSEWNTEEFLIRYKYILDPRIKQAPIIPTTRDFCAELLNKNFVWRVEDMDDLRNDFGQSAMVWRGGFNCRHRWAKLKYKKDATIINKGSITTGRVATEDYGDILGYPQPSTVTSATLANPSPSTVRNLGLSKETMGYDNTLPAYVDQVSGDTIEKSLAFESYTDYPESARNAAKRALDWAEKNGWGSCGTPVGKARANQLAKGEAISEETISRMASFARHLQYKDVPYSEGCGGLMVDAWGGQAGIEWAQNKLESIRKDMSKQKFQTDDEKRIVIGPAMIPDLKIFRKDMFGNPYYVFFSADTIKMIAEKYMRNKFIDNNDTNHDGKAVSDVYVIETWIKEDEQDKSNKYGYNDLPVGTWFVSMKIKNDEVWNKVKSGELRGFSVSGFFEEIADFAKEQMFLQEVAKILSRV